jgi:hypothetical protein
MKGVGARKEQIYFVPGSKQKATICLRPRFAVSSVSIGQIHDQSEGLPAKESSVGLDRET